MLEGDGRGWALFVLPSEGDGWEGLGTEGCVWLPYDRTCVGSCGVTYHCLVFVFCRIRVSMSVDRRGGWKGILCFLFCRREGDG